jgi:hypothetical protein
VTRSQVRHVTFADVGHRSNDTAATSTMDIEDWTDILVMSASLQSDPTLGVPGTQELQGTHEAQR